jgi:hypothetical protein
MKMGECGNERIKIGFESDQTAKDVPHPQVFDALGFWKLKPRAFNPFSQ